MQYLRPRPYDSEVLAVRTREWIAIKNNPNHTLHEMADRCIELLQCEMYFTQHGHFPPDNASGVVE